MKKRMAACFSLIACLLMLVPGCSKRQNAVLECLDCATTAYDTKLSYSLSTNGEVEMFSSYQTELTRNEQGEHIARTVEYYSLPMDENYWYVDGVYYYAGFDDTKICAELSEEDYAKQRENLLFLQFCDLDMYQSVSQSGAQLLLQGANASLEQYVKRCLGISTAVSLQNLHVDGAVKNEDGCDIFTLSIDGAYRLAGEDKTFTVSYSLESTDRTEEILAPDRTVYTLVQNFEKAKLFNGAYSSLALLENISLEGESFFHLVYSDADVILQEQHIYTQSIQQEYFTFTDQLISTLTMNGAVQTAEQTISYEDGTLQKSSGGEIYQSSEAAAADMLVDCRQYYNAYAPIYETIENSSCMQQGEQTVFFYTYPYDMVDSVFMQYIDLLYDDMDEILSQTTARTYQTVSGTLTLDGEGSMLSHEIALQAVYMFNGEPLTCTANVSIHRK